jgi:Tol biopolymer transport system component
VKRAELLWQGVILFLVFSFTVGVYVVLAVSVRQLQGRAPAQRPGSVRQDGSGVAIVEPLDGSLLQAGSGLRVQAVLARQGFVQAELRVDGQAVAAQFNPDPHQVPWPVEWTWESSGEGSHVLAVLGRDSGGEVVSSRPITVAVVPVGRLVLASNRDGAYALYAMETDGRNAVRLTTGPGDARQPAVRAGGGLAFVAENGAGQPVIREMAADSAESVALFAGREPAWSPHGERLAFTASQAGISQVVVAEVAAGRLLTVTAEAVYAGQPAWSPDGSRLAYVAERDRNLDIWIADVDGSEPRRLTDDPAVDWAPAWSPDGNWLAFVSNRSGSHQIYLMRADGSEQQRLTDLAQGAESPAWSPDGYWLAFVAYTGAGTGVDAREIYLMRADGRQQVRLTHNDYDDTEPDWAAMP